VRISADTVIDLFPMKPEEALGNGPGLQNLNHFTMVVEPADFEGFQKHLTEHGVKIEDGPGRRWGARGYGQSVYFRDPDGNRIELQIDNFATAAEGQAWMHSPAFDRNPIGVEFDPDDLVRKFQAGIPVAELVIRD